MRKSGVSVKEVTDDATTIESSGSSDSREAQ